MLDINTLVMFSLASILLALAPGPDNIFVLTQSMVKGSKAGVIITLGLCSGLIFHTSAVALGVAVIFQTSAVAFNLLKFVGALYLLYLAYMAFKDASKTKLDTNQPTLNPSALYKKGVFMNITNPKVSIFFLAFLPQFTNAANGHVTLQIFSLGAIFMIWAFVVFSLIALLAGKIGAWFSQTKSGEKILNRVAGSIFALLAVKLALAER
ncbi:MAG: LysE family translocator [Sulfurospirillaceae bacterium]|jgi:threonine/homoserine/homoserine lactone efflux protein|nr:LysE family translocator [Sulfurospirillaceae bacterium]MDD2826004.1 LysE family translocator [Sulfurospirillaceae bacterium]